MAITLIKTDNDSPAPGEKARKIAYLEGQRQRTREARKSIVTNIAPKEVRQSAKAGKKRLREEGKQIKRRIRSIQKGGPLT